MLLLMIETMLYLPLVGIVILSLIFSADIVEGKGNALYGLNFFVQNSALMYLIYLITGQNFHIQISIFFQVWYLGIITYAMILGHWYLVVPKLSEWHLTKALILFWVMLPLKLLLFRVWLYDKFRAFVAGSTNAMGYMFNWIMLLMRLGWGIPGYRHYGVLYLAINKNEEHTKCNWRFVCHDLFCFYWRAHRRLLSL